MERDKNSPRGGYSAGSYTSTLEEGLLPVYNGQTFIQYNASVHTAAHTQAFLAE